MSCFGRTSLSLGRRDRNLAPFAPGHPSSSPPPRAGPVTDGAPTSALHRRTTAPDAGSANLEPCPKRQAPAPPTLAARAALGCRQGFRALPRTRDPLLPTSKPREAMD